MSIKQPDSYTASFLPHFSPETVSGFHFTPHHLSISILLFYHNQLINLFVTFKLEPTFHGRNFDYLLIALQDLIISFHNDSYNSFYEPTLSDFLTILSTKLTSPTGLTLQTLYKRFILLLTHPTLLQNYVNQLSLCLQHTGPTRSNTSTFTYPPSSPFGTILSLYIVSLQKISSNIHLGIAFSKDLYLYIYFDRDFLMFKSGIEFQNAVRYRTALLDNGYMVLDEMGGGGGNDGENCGQDRNNYQNFFSFEEKRRIHFNEHRNNNHQTEPFNNLTPQSYKALGDNDTRPALLLPNQLLMNKLRLKNLASLNNQNNNQNRTNNKHQDTHNSNHNNFTNPLSTTHLDLNLTTMTTNSLNMTQLSDYNNKNDLKNPKISTNEPKNQNSSKNHNSSYLSPDLPFHSIHPENSSMINHSHLLSNRYHFCHHKNSQKPPHHTRKDFHKLNQLESDLSIALSEQEKPNFTLFQQNLYEFYFILELAERQLSTQSLHLYLSSTTLKPKLFLSRPPNSLFLTAIFIKLNQFFNAFCSLALEHSSNLPNQSQHQLLTLLTTNLFTKSQLDPSRTPLLSSGPGLPTNGPISTRSNNTTTLFSTQISSLSLHSTPSLQIFTHIDQDLESNQILEAEIEKRLAILFSTLNIDTFAPFLDFSQSLKSSISRQIDPHIDSLLQLHSSRLFTPQTQNALVSDISSRIYTSDSHNIRAMVPLIAPEIDPTPISKIPTSLNTQQAQRIVDETIIYPSLSHIISNHSIQNGFMGGGGAGGGNGAAKGSPDPTPKFSLSHVSSIHPNHHITAISNPIIGQLYHFERVTQLVQRANPNYHRAVRYSNLHSIQTLDARYLGKLNLSTIQLQEGYESISTMSLASVMLDKARLMGGVGFKYSSMLYNALSQQELITSLYSPQKPVDTSLTIAVFDKIGADGVVCGDLSAGKQKAVMRTMDLVGLNNHYKSKKSLIRVIQTKYTYFTAVMGMYSKVLKKLTVFDKMEKKIGIEMKTKIRNAANNKQKKNRSSGITIHSSIPSVSKLLPLVVQTPLYPSQYLILPPALAVEEERINNELKIYKNGQEMSSDKYKNDQNETNLEKNKNTQNATKNKTVIYSPNSLIYIYRYNELLRIALDINDINSATALAQRIISVLPYYHHHFYLNLQQSLSSQLFLLFFSIFTNLSHFSRLISNLYLSSLFSLIIIHLHYSQSQQSANRHIQIQTLLQAVQGFHLTSPYTTSFGTKHSSQSPFSFSAGNNNQHFTYNFNNNSSQHISQNRPLLSHHTTTLLQNSSDSIGIYDSTMIGSQFDPWDDSFNTNSFQIGFNNTTQISNQTFQHYDKFQNQIDENWVGQNNSNFANIPQFEYSPPYIPSTSFLSILRSLRISTSALPLFRLPALPSLHGNEPCSPRHSSHNLDHSLLSANPLIMAQIETILTILQQTFGAAGSTSFPSITPQPILPIPSTPSSHQIPQTTLPTYNPLPVTSLLNLFTSLCSFSNQSGINTGSYIGFNIDCINSNHFSTSMLQSKIALLINSLTILLSILDIDNLVDSHINQLSTPISPQNSSPISINPSSPRNVLITPSLAQLLIFFAMISYTLLGNKHLTLQLLALATPSLLRITSYQSWALSIALNKSWFVGDEEIGDGFEGLDSNSFLFRNVPQLGIEKSSQYDQYLIMSWLLTAMISISECTARPLMCVNMETIEKRSAIGNRPKNVPNYITTSKPLHMDHINSVLTLLEQCAKYSWSLFQHDYTIFSLYVLIRVFHFKHPHPTSSQTRHISPKSSSLPPFPPAFNSLLSTFLNYHHFSQLTKINPQPQSKPHSLGLPRPSSRSPPKVSNLSDQFLDGSIDLDSLEGKEDDFDQSQFKLHIDNTDDLIGIDVYSDEFEENDEFGFEEGLYDDNDDDIYQMALFM